MFFATLLGWLKPGSRPKAHRAGRKRPAACRLCLERLEDRTLPSVQAVSLADPLLALGTGNGPSYAPFSVSGDGRLVAFSSSASNLVANDANNSFDVFVRDVQTGGVTLVSATSSGSSANQRSSNPVISADGRWVAFESSATNLVPNVDGNRQSDVFVRDLVTGTTTLISATSTGSSGNGQSYAPVISGDGRFVAFLSEAGDLVAGDMNGGRTDVFVRDLQTGLLTLVSATPTGASGNGNSLNPVMSSDGRFVAFQSDAANLVANDGNGATDVFVRDLETGTTILVSAAGAGSSADNNSFAPSISGDGRFVAFYSGASNLAANDANGTTDVFVRDLQTRTTILVSATPLGRTGSSPSFNPVISADGRFVAFESSAGDLVANDGNGTGDVFVRDLGTATTTLVSATPGGASGNSRSANPVISSDGHVVAFTSLASNLVANDNNAMQDVFVRDLGTGITNLASTTPAGNSGNGLSRYPVISANGRTVVFESRASDLVANDNNNVEDVFALVPPNQPPTADAGGPYDITEGAALTLDAAHSSDADGDPLTYSWDVNGDGVYGDASGVNPTLTWAQLQALGINDGPNTFAIRVQVDDGHGHVVTSPAATMTVGNTPPVLTLSGDTVAYEGWPGYQTYTLRLSATDPGNDTISQWTIHWGDGSVQTVAGHPASVTHTWADGPNDYTISATATDEDGTYDAANTIAVHVNNSAPLVGGTFDYDGASEGRPWTPPDLGFFNDAANDGPWFVYIDWGDGDPHQQNNYYLFDTGAAWPLVPLGGIPHTYADSGIYHGSVSVRDKDLGVGIRYVTFRVSNVAPTTTFSNSGPVLAASPVTVSFTNPFDPSSADTAAGFTYSYDFDNDGVFDVVSSSPSQAHTFAEAGTYTVRGRIADKDGGFSDYATMVAVTAPAVTLSATGLDFGGQLLATVSTPQSVTLTNSGTAALTVSGFGVSGDAADFVITAAAVYPATLAPGQSFDVQIAFAPTAAGSRSALLTFADDAPNGPHTIALTGTGVVAVLDLSATDLSFGAQPVGTASTPLTVTLTNSGSGPLTVAGLSVSGDAAGDFAVSAAPSLPIILAPGQSASLLVTFVPTVAGSRAALLTLFSNASNAPQTITLGGTGLAVVRTVTIDVKPGSTANLINLQAGTVNVAVLTTAEFDAAGVDAASALFAQAHAFQSQLLDVDGDGDLDLMLQFRLQETNLRETYEQLLAACDQTVNGILDPGCDARQQALLSLTGTTLDGSLLEGTDIANLFLAGKALRQVLDELAAAGLI